MSTPAPRSTTSDPCLNLDHHISEERRTMRWWQRDGKALTADRGGQRLWFTAETEGARPSSSACTPPCKTWRARVPILADHLSPTFRPAYPSSAIISERSSPLRRQIGTLFRRHRRARGCRTPDRLDTTRQGYARVRSARGRCTGSRRAVLLLRAGTSDVYAVVGLQRDPPPRGSRSSEGGVCAVQRSVGR